MFKKLIVGALFSFIASPASAMTVVAFDFENANSGDSIAAASVSAPFISDAVFGGPKFDSRVTNGSKRYVTSTFPASSGGWYLYMSFTTSQSMNLDLLSFTAGQNDLTPALLFGDPSPRGPHHFDILLSPLNDPTPNDSTADGLRDPALNDYTLLDTISVPYGFALGEPNFEVDLSTLMLAPGTYHMAFAVSPSSATPPQDPFFETNGINVQTTGLFMDNISLTVSAVPLPASAWLFGTALIGLFGLNKRRKA